MLGLKDRLKVGGGGGAVRRGGRSPAGPRAAGRGGGRSHNVTRLACPDAKPEPISAGDHPLSDGIVTSPDEYLAAPGPQHRHSAWLIDRSLPVRRRATR